MVCCKYTTLSRVQLHVQAQRLRNAGPPAVFSVSSASPFRHFVSNSSFPPTAFRCRSTTCVYYPYTAIRLISSPFACVTYLQIANLALASFVTNAFDPSLPYCVRHTSTDGRGATMRYPIGGVSPGSVSSASAHHGEDGTLLPVHVGRLPLRRLTLRRLTLRISHPPPRESRALSRKKQNTTNQTVLLFKPLPHPNSAQLKPTLTSIHSNQTHPFPIAFPKKFSPIQN